MSATKNPETAPSREVTSTTPDLELDERRTDGNQLIVRLMLKGDGSKGTYVTVDDLRNGEQLTVPVPEPALAGKVFQHPFSYPALRPEVSPEDLAA